jgi:hypothetical protein
MDPQSALESYLLFYTSKVPQQHTKICYAFFLDPTDVKHKKYLQCHSIALYVLTE